VSISGLAVDRFAHDVEMTGMSRRLFDHVDENPSERDVANVALYQLSYTPGGSLMIVMTRKWQMPSGSERA
jgi:hypothetical protein